MTAALSGRKNSLESPMEKFIEIYIRTKTWLETGEVLTTPGSLMYG
jgi:hypothetical protein